MIDYVATDNAATSTRTVVIECNPNASASAQQTNIKMFRWGYRLRLKFSVLQGASTNEEAWMAAKAKKSVRREWTKSDIKELKAHSRERTPVPKIAKATKRTIGALRQKAFALGIGLGRQHR